MERALFERIGKDDPKAFQELFDSYCHKLKWHAFHIIKSEFWAEEVVQDVFTNLWAARESLAEIENPGAYLHKMTGNRCLDRIRRHRLEMEMQYIASAVVHGGSSAFQEGQYDLQLIKLYIKEAIDVLPEQRRLIYLLQQEEGLNYQQIADRLQLSRNTVRNQMSKSLQAIRSHLQQKGPFILIIGGVYYFF